MKPASKLTNKSMRLSRSSTHGDDVSYTDGPFAVEGDLLLEEVDDFLPSPSELVDAKRMVRVALLLPLETLTYFKRFAVERQVSHVEIMQQVLVDYASAQAAEAKKLDEAVTT